jgi:hypothetical protein
MLVAMNYSIQCVKELNPNITFSVIYTKVHGLNV